MATVRDVAAFILRERAPMTSWKLQKLVYYSQAWSLVWDEAPLFPEKIKAWKNGPVCPELYHLHKGRFDLEAGAIAGNPDALKPEQVETIRAVLRAYGDKTGQWLSDLTHAEKPWRDARDGVADDEPSSKEITPAAMAEYYGSLSPESAQALG